MKLNKQIPSFTIFLIYKKELIKMKSKDNLKPTRT